MSYSVSAQDLGGWSEDTGYFTYPTSSVSALAASSPSHRAWKNYRAGGSQPYERVNGETTWSGTYHYSRARYEWLVTGSVESDSGRVWGTGYTLATSWRFCYSQHILW
ncbi:hypothetical protein GJU40_04695 [Bacillus lacus]|uniref:Uncharacterized protein n=2 Tax=Metabacillus lacus TaxID=1983721 RepID=A0A7X2IXV8_9BACI|nr:hypothetical protein [Metabacillus lacus]